MTTTIAVIGTGSVGSQAMWQLARRGVDVIGFEQYGVPHDRGAHGAESRIFRTGYLEGAHYIPVLLRARQLWLDLEHDSGIRVFEQCGLLSIGNPAAGWLSTTLAGLQDFSLPHDVLDAEDAAIRFPQHGLRPDEVAVLDHLGGVLRPEAAVRAATALAQARGAVLHEYTHVRDLTANPDRITVITSRGRYHADEAIVTPGPYAADLPFLAGLPITARRITASWFPATDHRRYQPSLFPPFIKISPDMDGCPMGISGFPALDGQTVKVGVNGGEQPQESAAALDRSVTAAEMRHLGDLVARHLPGLHPRPLRCSGYMDGYSPDSAPVIIPRFAASNIVVLCGFSGHGFKLSSAMGEIAADLVTGRRPAADTTAFRYPRPLRDATAARVAAASPYQHPQ